MFRNITVLLAGGLWLPKRWEDSRGRGIEDADVVGRKRLSHTRRGRWIKLQHIAYIRRAWVGGESAQKRAGGGRRAWIRVLDSHRRAPCERGPAAGTRPPSSSTPMCTVRKAQYQVGRDDQ